MAPYFKDIVCYVGQSECYESSSALIEKTMSIEVDDNTIHRLCNEYGEKSELWLAEERTTEEGKPEVGSTEVLYAHCDGGMALTRPSECAVTGWDGRYSNGGNAPTDVYFYVFKAILSSGDEIETKGDITLLRR